MRLEELFTLRTLILTFLPLLALPPLLTIPLLSFYTFYTTSIPAPRYDFPVSLQYTPVASDHVYPLPFSSIHGSILLPGSLHANTAYKLIVHLTVPPSPQNLLLGNLALSLNPSNLSPPLTALGILPYRTPWIRTLRTALYAPLYILDLKRESESISVEMGRIVLPPSSFTEGKRDRPILKLDISGGAPLSVYSCRIEILAELSGWRYYVQRYKWLVGLWFYMVFLGIEVVTAAWAWWNVSVWLETRETRRGVGRAEEIGKREGVRYVEPGDQLEVLDDASSSVGLSAEEDEDGDGGMGGGGIEMETLEVRQRQLPTPSPTPSFREDEGIIADDEKEGGKSTSFRGRGESLRRRRSGSAIGERTN